MADPSTGLRLVPFNPVWINHDKIDIHAIYRRPRFVEDKYGERQREYDAHGLPTWDLTGGLPVRQHTRWASKGFEYVTLADKESLIVAGVNNTIPDVDWRTFMQHRVGGPWNYKLYAEGQEATYTREGAQLAADVRTFGSAAVLAIRRQREPEFALPPHLMGIEPARDEPRAPEKTRADAKDPKGSAKDAVPA